jgi:hypothetical protein
MSVDKTAVKEHIMNSALDELAEILFRHVAKNKKNTSSSAEKSGHAFRRPE